MPFRLTKPPAGALVNWGHPLAQGLVHRSLFNERSGNAAFDVVTRRQGVFTAGTGGAKPLFSADDNGSIEPLGTGSARSTIDFGVDPMTAGLHQGFFTVVARVKFVAAAGGLARRNNGNVSQGWLVGSNNTNFGYGIVCSTTDLVYTVANPTVGVWVWVAVVHDNLLSASSAGKGIYYDGVKQATASTTTGVGNLASDAAQSLTVGETNFQIGAQFNAASWAGKISDFAIWRRALTALEIRAYITSPYANLGLPQKRIWLASRIAVTHTASPFPALTVAA